MKQTIVSINSIGFRCPSTEFLSHHKLRKMSSPFDNMFCDIESSLKIIHNKFDDFLNDLLFYCPYDFSKHSGVLYEKNTNEINPIFRALAKGNKITYMKHDYYLSHVFFNQNYTLNDDIISRDISSTDTSNYVKDSDNHLETEEEIMMAKIEKNTSNMYNWKHICCFNHHKFLKDSERDHDLYNTLRKRCERFNYIMSKYPENTALFYMTRIMKYENYVDYVKNIIELKIKYKIPCFMIIIVNCDNVEYNDIHEHYDELNKCLFILKKVMDYDTQLKNFEIDGCLHPSNQFYVKEFNIIKKYFDFDLVEKRDIDNAILL